MGDLFIGVDTSNYTTSLALVKDGIVVASVRRLLPVKQGERGLRQSDALFHHTKALPELAAELFAHPDYRPQALRAVGVSYAPRDREGSYMPCFLAGVSFASALAGALCVPLYRFSHQAGHIAAALYSCDSAISADRPFLSFHVSGGTTDVLYVEPKDVGYDYHAIGGSDDLHAGQAIDRIGVCMGLDFPCGPALDVLSQQSQTVYTPKVKVKNGFCSLSGVENQCLKRLDQQEDRAEVAAYLFDYLAQALVGLTNAARESYPSLSVIYAGGVMANTRIRNRLAALADTHFASTAYSSDNACGTALLAADAFDKEALL